MYCELHTHSDFSNLRLIDSTMKVESIIDKAIEMGFVGCAITDHESLSGHIRAIRHIKKRVRENPELKRNFSLILGNEIYLINESDHGNTTKFPHFILLAKDKIGHRQLRELSTRAWGRMYSFKGLDRVPTFYSDLEEIIGENSGHIIGLTACLGGYFPHLLLNNRFENAKLLSEWCIDIFGADNFFVEIAPGIDEEQMDFNRKAISFCKQNNLNWVITNDVHYLTQDKRELHAAYLNSKDEERETGDFYESTYFKTESEMLQRMSYLDETDVLTGFENTVKIANSVEIYDLKHEVVIPERKLPKFELLDLFRPHYSHYPHIRYFATSPYEQDRFMLSMIERGFKEKGEEFNSENLSRIDIELKQLWLISEKLNQQLSSYYNLVEQIIEIMWDDEKGNSLVGVARGSVTGFYICYLMGITQINPIKWNLPYWRHIHELRPELPDIDIDSQASQRPRIFQAMKDEFGQTNSLNIVTFKRETSKAAILTSCRGLGIDTDTAREIAALVPVSRGMTWSITECLEGNEENGFVPHKEFVRKIKEFDMLLETVLEIENLVCGRSSHASGFYLFNSHYLKQNSLMKTPKGIDVTCWDMGDSDECGALKVDILTIEALDKIRKTMDLLIADGKIAWQGNLKATYDKYLHPNVLDYDTKEMWDMLGDGRIVDVFQFDTLTGGESVAKIRPANLKQMAIANSVMRLMSDEGVSPTDRFVKNKSDIQEWYREMDAAGLTPQEVKVLEKYLLDNFGCSVEQEDVMELSMDAGIANFDIVQANKLRKGISKKVKTIIEDARAMFFESGLRVGTRREMLDYVWNHCIKPQLGYSFSRNHTLPYSAIGLQEMNLAYHYPIIYWNTACLTINASANEEIEDNKSTNYGKIAKAISDMQTQGVRIALPDINTSKFGFSPDEENNQIIFGLKGINSVGDEIVHNILSNRPYASLDDFFNKNSIDTRAMINLVKSGCFDNLVGQSRDKIMRKFITLLTLSKVEAKSKLTLQNFNSVIELGIIPDKFDFQRRLYSFRKYIFQSENLIEKNKYLLDDVARPFFENQCAPSLTEGQCYWISVNGDIAVSKTKFDKWYDSQMIDIKSWLTDPQTLEDFNEAQYRAYADEIWGKYCLGNISKWEMDSLSFYYTEHELSGVNKVKYDITDYGDISPDPIIVDRVARSKSKAKGSNTVYWDKYQLYKIVGTVLDKNANKHYITLLTTDGVVVVKFYEGSFNHYNKQLSKKNEGEDKKTIIEKSWFARGNKLLITGIRRGNMFLPKRYYDSIYQHTVCLILECLPNGDLELKFERERVL